MTNRTDQVRSARSMEFSQFLKLCAELGVLEAAAVRRALEFARAFGGIARVPWFEGPHPENPETLQQALRSYLPKEMTFESFVASESSQIAYEVSRTISHIERTWSALTPLFLHGGTGLGKTHLMVSMARAFRGSSIYMDTANLGIQLQHLASARGIDQLSEWLLSHQMILLDDLQLCGSDEALQNLLHNVASEAWASGKALIAASNRPPSELTELPEPLVSRISSGVVASVGMPGMEGRRTLLRRLFESEGFTIDDRVEELAAGRATQSVRQLMSAGKSLIAEMLSTGGPLTIERTEDLLSSLGLPKIDPGGAYESRPSVDSESNSRTEPSSAEPSSSGPEAITARLRQIITSAGSVSEVCAALTEALTEWAAGSGPGDPAIRREACTAALTHLEEGDLQGALGCLEVLLDGGSSI